MPPLLTTLRAMPRPVWILFGGTFINRFGTFVMPFLAIYLSREGYTPAQTGIAISAYGGGHIVASMLGGHLADTIGRRHTIALSMFGSSVAMLALSQAQGLPMITLMSFAVGLVGEIYRPAAAALLADLVPEEGRVMAFGLYRLAINLGFAIGPATAGFLAEKSFFLIFAVDAATSFVYGIVALVALPHGLRGATREESPAEGVRVALRDRQFVLFLLATLCVTFVEFQIHSTFPLHLATLGHSPATYGLLLSINGVMIVLFELGLTAWTQRMPQQPLIAIGYALSAIGFALTGIAAGVPMLAATVVIWTIGEMIYAPVAGAYVTNLAPERYRGRYMGLWHSMFSGGMLLGPILGTMLYQWDPNALWITCALVGILSALLAIVRVRPVSPVPLAAQE
jgi:MFS family permease